MLGGGSAGGGFKVTIQGDNGKVVFEASSPVSESREVVYDNYSIVHLPTDLFAYRNTMGRRFSITGRLVSRNAAEATTNANNLNLIRSWAQPGFGTTGSTPTLLYLSAYGSNNINQLQTILQSYSFTYPPDVDYVWTGSEPMPVIGDITLNLAEAYSAQQITNLAWKIKLASASGGLLSSLIGGAVNGVLGATPSLSSLTAGLGSGVQGLASSVIASALPSVSGTLGSVTGALSGAIPQLGSAASTLGVTISSEITDVTSKVSSLSTNQFVSGLSSAAINQLSATASAQVASAAAAITSDAFGRSSGLKVPTFIGG